MNHYLYIITNLMNGKKYIGKRSCSCPIEEDKYMGSGKVLSEEKKKYGIKNFEKKILLVCDSDDEVYKEEGKAIQLVRAWENPMYYNIHHGGKGFESKEHNPLYGLTGEKCPYAKKVVCLNTKEIFDYINQAAEKYNINQSSISANCRGRQRTAGIHPESNEPLVWMYFDDYTKKSIDEIHKITQDNIRNSRRKKRVVCLNTMEIFESIYIAGEKYCIAAPVISQVCKGKRKSLGKHPKTGEPLIWMYLEDYENKYEKMNKETS